MKLAAAVLTYNTHRFGRHELLLETLRSLNVPDVPVFIWDNGSNDGTQDLVLSLGGQTNRGPHRTIGDGMNAVIGLAVKSGADVVCFSNDDVRWKPGWADKVRAFWDDAPTDIGICSGLLETRLWYWNQITAAHDIGGQRVLERETVPGAAWTFRASTWDRMRPVPNLGNEENDVPVCHKLRERGMRLVAADWVTHLGDGKSTWGNMTHLHGEPLDRQKWGV